MNQRRWRLDIDQVAEPLHVRLSRENPEVADQEIRHRDHGLAALQADFEPVGSSYGYALQLTGPFKFLDFRDRRPVEAGDGSGVSTDQARFDILPVNPPPARSRRTRCPPFDRRRAEKPDYRRGRR